ncbi:VOC family protein [Aeromicrobium sp. 636]|uniref:VOC family protein n=1 Tax=Aeromicrobium senzhongii TaxID=2663859 RepID=A0A8I0EXN5_9ACTN|nr:MULTISPECIES: VOC family protein [Aeromicrobium]MBC9227297.1 VOC family protein [Aeromicrobium senzhongii]MCQ3999395.1 VOC family protein [Aeromicrobium sp. 636]MTB88293.1 VOC family protein [Aeromicrobium senzhongii]QNL94728.1 VOC family protein [Aeromicrobium senzhongii]
MHLDHLSFAVGPAGLMATTSELSEKFGAVFLAGGIHPRFGTNNMILPLKNRQYLEVVEALEHPASDKAAFGQAVKARSELGGGWLGWCVSVDDIEPVEHRLGRHAVPGNRHRPDGYNLTWQQIGIHGMRADPQLPFVMCWDVPPEEHPSQMADTGIALTGLEIAGSPERLSDWMGEPAVGALEDIEVRWVAPNGAPGILAAEFDTPNGPVRI